tara:strand:+ start:2676 stop:3689 length:1014 start_codon:yes stop_codon:yes gene_type:complete
MKKLNSALMATLLIASSIAYAIPTNKYVVYFSGWSAQDYTIDQIAATNANVLNLAFGNVTDDYEITNVDGMLTPSKGTEWKEAPYNQWTNFKFQHPQVKVLLSIGGATYARIWDTVLTEESADTIANNMIATLNTEYPVYEFDSSYIPHQVGLVTLDGIDLDVEIAAHRLTEQETANVTKLIHAIRKQLPAGKLLTMATFSTAADPSSCQTIDGPQCSYTGSTHSGEIIPVLQQAGADLDWVNNMAYDAGKNYKYQVSMENYASHLSPSKTVLGLSLDNQWAAEGDFLEDLADLEKKATWAKENGYAGSMVWSLGSDELHPQPADQVSDIAAISEHA